MSMNFKFINLMSMNFKLINLKLVVFLVLFSAFWCLVFFLCFFVLVKSYCKKKDKMFKTDLITSSILLLSDNIEIIINGEANEFIKELLINSKIDIKITWNQ